MDITINRGAASVSISTSGNGKQAVNAKAFSNLRNDLQSGDMDGAQQAFSTMTRNVPAAVLNDTSTALGQLNQALQTGDTAGAQKALGEFAKNVHSYRHGGGSSDPVSGGPVSVPASADPVTSSTGGTAGSIVNTVA